MHQRCGSIYCVVCCPASLARGPLLCCWRARERSAVRVDTHDMHMLHVCACTCTCHMDMHMHMHVHVGEMCDTFVAVSRDKDMKLAS